MKLLSHFKKQFLLVISLILIGTIAQAQFPVGPISLPKNKSIKIAYEVTIKTPIPQGVTTVSNQGTITGTNFTSVLTDDPTEPGATDPTVTPLDVPPFVLSINRQTPSVQLTNATSVVFRVTFSENVSGVDISDFSLTNTGDVNGTVATVSSATGTTIDVTVNSITGDGTMRLDLNNSGTAIVDDGSTAITGGFNTGQIYTFDHIVPTVTINQAAGQVDPTNTSPINFTVIFSEPITGFTNTDVLLSGTAGATTVVVTETAPMNGTTYNVAVSGMAMSGTVIASIPAGGVLDPAGNTNTVSTSTDNTVTYDITQPTVTINQAASQVDPSNSSPINFTVVFSEPINGFTNIDVTLSGTAGATTAVVTEIAPMNGTTYNLAVSGMTTSGTVIASIPAGSVSDATGNTNTVSTSTDNTVTYDITQPTLTINQAAAQGDPTNTSPINFTVVFNEPINGFTNTDVMIGGTAGATTVVITEIAPMNGTSFNVALSGMVSNGTVIATVSAGGVFDAAGNQNTASTSTDNTVTYDISQPTVTINQAAGQSDPTNGSPINFTVVFSEPITGFINTDVSLGGTAGATTVVITEIAPMNGTTFNVAVSGMTANGTVTANIGAGVVTDASGNQNTASTSTDNTVTYDITRPSVTINQSATQADPTSNSTINFTVVFSEAVTGFATGDVTISGTAGATTAIVTEITPMNGTTYNVAVSGMTMDGTVIVSIAANKATDAAGNQNTASVSTDNTVTFILCSAPQILTGPSSAQIGECSATPVNFSVNATGDGLHYQWQVNGVNTGTDASTLSFNASGLAPNTYTVRVDITGDCGSDFAETTLAVNADDVDPVISGCPTTVTVQTGAGNTLCSKAATWTEPTATDNCDGALTYFSRSHAPGDVFPVGNTTVTYIFRDDNGNESTCSFNVVVQDNTPPVVSACPSSFTVYTGAGNTACSKSATWTEPTAMDNCGGSLAYFSRSHAPGSTFNVGNTTVTYVFKDAAGNTSNCSFVVTVTDNTPPVISCPANVTVNAAAGQCTAVVSVATLGSPTATDNCTAAPTKSASGVPAGNLFPVGITNIIWTATDAAGNTSTCLQTVTVRDNQPPTFSTPLSVSQANLWPPNHKMSDIITLAYQTSDNCSSCTPTVSITSNQPINGTGDGDTSPDWEIIDATHIRLRAERANHSEQRIYTITVTCTDGGGNTATSSATVVVAHNIVSPTSGKPFIVGSTVNFNGVFWDKPGNKHTAQWLIDGGTIAKAIVTEPAGNKNGKVAGSYKFNTAGVYKLQMNVIDQNKNVSYANTNEDLEAIVVIYDPNGGNAYGGGWFNSPAGALVGSSAATGKASYGFAVNYFKNATYPKGETQFEFKIGEFEFNALNFDYMVIQGAKAQFKGSGKITGDQSGYAFIMTVTDGALDGTGIDKVRMKIFNKNTNAVIYDNQPGASDADVPVAAVGTNSTIVISGTPVNNNPINTKASPSATTNEAVVTFDAQVMPNPSREQFTIYITSDDLKGRVKLEVFDAYGRLIESKPVNAGSFVKIGGSYRPGTYFIRLTQGNKHKELKLIKIAE